MPPVEDREPRSVDDAVSHSLADEGAEARHVVRATRPRELAVSRSLPPRLRAGKDPGGCRPSRLPRGRPISPDLRREASRTDVGVPAKYREPAAIPAIKIANKRATTACSGRGVTRSNDSRAMGIGLRLGVGGRTGQTGLASDGEHAAVGPPHGRVLDREALGRQR